MLKFYTGIKYIISGFAVILCSNLYGQITTQELLINATNSFNSNDYDKVLEVASIFYNQHVRRDSMYFEMKRFEYLSYNRLGQNGISKRIISELINDDIEGAYSCYDNISQHYRNYLILSEPKEDIDTYEKAIRSVLQKKNVYFSYKDYQYYAKFLQYKYGELSYQEKLDFFKKEDIVVKDYTKSYFDAFYNYVKGLLIVDGEWKGERGSLNFHSATAKTQIKKACSCFRQADELYSSKSDMPETISDHYNQLLEKIVNSYSSIGHYDAAAYFQRKKLDLLYKNWKRWNRSSPWNAENHFMVNHKMTEYEVYIELLFDSQQYYEILKYSNSVLLDVAFAPYREEMEEYVIYHMNRAKVALGEIDDYATAYTNRYNNFYEYSWLENNYRDLRGEQISIEEIVSKYRSGKLTAKDISSSYTMNYLKLYRYLYECNDYQAIIYITGIILEDFHKEYLVDPLCYYYDINGKPYSPIENLRITEYDKVIASDRELWHHANGISGIWLSYKYRASAFAALGDYDNAIDNQRKCVDNLRTDWEFDPDERDNLFDSRWETFSHNFYINFEKEELYNMAEYYRMNGEFENAAIFYRKLLSLNRYVLLKLFDASSWDEKVQQWENHNAVYRQIIRNADIVNNPYFSDIVFECSSMLKSFLLNVKLNEHAVVDTNESYHTRTLWEKKLRIDRISERECYLQNEVHDSFLDGIEISAELETIINTASLLPSEDLFLKVKNALRPNEVFVDFFITKEIQMEYMLPYEDKWRHTVRPYISACVCRSNWDKPKIVSLNHLVEYSSEYLLPRSEYSQQATNDLQFGKEVWEEILTVSEIVNNDIIYFVPTGSLNHISLENLMIDDGEYMSDRYQLYRLTSYRQMFSPSDRISKDDKWALFASRNTSFGERSSTKCNTEFQSLSTLKLSDTDELPGAARTIDYIYAKENYSSLRKYYDDFNEVEFYNLSMKSPSLIYIGSHGYYLNDSLNKADSLYLFGSNRSVMLTREEASMYKSGIVMNRVPRYYTTTSDGLLTAKEISLLDLSTTKLVCVSACSTGLGINTIEGVYGLQRGFKLAGVQSLLVSLWDVDDKATEILMTAFYDNLRLGFSKQESLKAAQQTVRTYVGNDADSINLGDIYQYDDPYYWAGFVLIDGNE